MQSDGPLIIASNHPNSFLDAIILSILFKRPVHSLARGDAFNNKFVAMLLRSIHMLPVYRTSEGVENLEHNYTTFDRCKNIFRKNGIVLIFSEGRCINEWHLRSLKKGTARLAVSSWQDGIDVKILPCGLNYQSFTSFGKNVQLNFGNMFDQTEIDLANGQGKALNSFNDRLLKTLQPLILEIDSNDTAVIQNQFAVHISTLNRIFLFIPALLGYIVHWPLYFPLQKYSSKMAYHNDHYDSVLVGVLFLSYPFYLIIIAVSAYIIFGGWWWLITFILFPFCAWSYVQLKKQF